MDLSEYVRVVRRRWRLIGLTTVVGLGVAGLLTFLQAPVFESDTQLYVSASGDSGFTDAATANQYIQNRINSYVLLVEGAPVTRRAQELLAARGAPTTLGTITADAPSNTVLMNVQVTGPTPSSAQVRAKAVTDAFVEIIRGLEPAGPTQSRIAVTVVKPASLPTSPVRPRPTTNILLGLVAGLFVGASLALVRETMDTRIASPEALERNFGVPTLSVVSFDPGARKQPLIPDSGGGGPRAEAYRRLRTNLQFSNLDTPMRSLVVTSSVPGEGKTTTACNLAILLARAGVPVALLEGDLRRPRVADYLGIEGAVGLTDVLIGRIPLEEALQPWGNSGNLVVLPSGALPPNPSEVLGSHHMADLLKTLERDRTVIIDAPPLLPVTDAAVIGALSTGVLLMVRARSTHREHVASSLQSLEDVGARLLGAVFNMAPTSGPDAQSYQYHYYDSSSAQQTDRGRPRLDAPVEVTPAMREVGRHSSDDQPTAEQPNTATATTAFDRSASRDSEPSGAGAKGPISEGEIAGG